LKHGGRLHEVLLAYREELEAYAAGILRDEALAQDLLQDVWFRVAGLDWETVQSPRSFLFRTVRNAAIDRRRALLREGPVAEVSPDLPSALPSPERQLSDKQALSHVLKALHKLPERTRQAVLLHRVEGLKLREIADRLEVSIGLAHALVRDGVAACAEGLSRED